MQGGQFARVETCAPPSRYRSSLTPSARWVCPDSVVWALRKRTRWSRPCRSSWSNSSRTACFPQQQSPTQIPRHQPDRRAAAPLTTPARPADRHARTGPFRRRQPDRRTMTPLRKKVRMPKSPIQHRRPRPTSPRSPHQDGTFLRHRRESRGRTPLDLFVRLFPRHGNRERSRIGNESARRSSNTSSIPHSRAVAACADGPP